MYVVVVNALYFYDFSPSKPSLVRPLPDLAFVLFMYPPNHQSLQRGNSGLVYRDR